VKSVAPPARRLGFATAVLITGFLLAGGSPALAHTTSAHAVPPLAAQASGACTDSAGVTVVVDYTDLGGGIVIRCAAWPIGTGYEALNKAGFSVTQPSHSPGFVCRIDGQPSAATEPCVNTPPTSAYWGYWYAPNHGSWTYSTTGAWGRQPIKGGYEGWAFEKGRSKAVAPRVAPSHPVPAPPPPSRTPTSHPPATPSPSSSTGPANGSTRAKIASTGTQPTTETATTGPKQKQHKSRETQQVGNPTGEEISTPPTARANASDQVSSTAAHEPQQDSGSPVATIVGAGIVAVLAALGGFVAWRRRTGGP
jgi:hypothetical protein